MSVSSYLYLSVPPVLSTCVLVPVCAPCDFCLSASSYLAVSPVLSICLCLRIIMCPPGALYPSCVSCAFHPVSVFIAGVFHRSVSLVLYTCRVPPAFSAVSCIPMCFLPVRVHVPVCVLGALHLSCVPVLSPCLMFAVLSTCLMSLVLLPVLRPMCFLPVCVSGVFCRLSACAARPFCLSVQYQALNFHLCVSGPVLPIFLCAHGPLNLVACTYLFSWPFIIICVYGTFLSVHKVIFYLPMFPVFCTCSLPYTFYLTVSLV